MMASLQLDQMAQDYFIRKLMDLKERSELGCSRQKPLAKISALDQEHMMPRPILTVHREPLIFMLKLFELKKFSQIKIINNNKHLLPFI